MSAALPYQPEREGKPAAPLLPPGAPAAGRYDTDHGSAPSRRLRRLFTLGPIVLLHVGLFHALESGKVRDAAKIPEVMFATLIETAPKTPAPPAEMKNVVLPKVAVPTAVPLPQPDIVVASVAAPPAPEAPAVAPSEPAAPSRPQVTNAAPAPSAPKAVSTVEYLQAPKPDYPPLSRRKGEQGKVMLRVLVGEKGLADRIEIAASSGFPRLDEAARHAVARAVFKPHVEDGRAIPVYVTVPIGFSLD